MLVENEIDIRTMRWLVLPDARDCGESFRTSLQSQTHCSSLLVVDRCMQILAGCVAKDYPLNDGSERCAYDESVKVQAKSKNTYRKGYPGRQPSLVKAEKIFSNENAIRKLFCSRPEIWVEGRLPTPQYHLAQRQSCNPWAGRYVEDLKPEIQALGPLPGELLTQRIVL